MATSNSKGKTAAADWDETFIMDKGKTAAADWDGTFMDIVEKGSWIGFDGSCFQALQIICQIQIATSEAKVNVRYCNLLHEVCNIVRDWLFDLWVFVCELKLCVKERDIIYHQFNAVGESLCGISQLPNVLDRAKILILECRHLEIAFLDKTAEFADIHERIISCVKMFYKTDLELCKDLELCNDYILLRWVRDELDKMSLIEDKLQKLGLLLEENALLQKKRERKDFIDLQYLTIKFDRLLRQGSFNVVYEGKWFGMAVAVAVAVAAVRDDIMVMIESWKRRESHPHILQIFGYCRKGESIYVVMELMDTDLGRVIEEGKDGMEGPFPLRTAIDIMLQIAKAMSYLHAQGIFDLDLSLANILVKRLPSHPGNVLIKVAGFHLAKFQTCSAHTGGYESMASDMFFNPDTHSKKMDVYSFGITCTEILTRSFGKCKIYPQNLQNLLKSCCKKKSDERPDFHIICNDLGNLQEELYSDYVGCLLYYQRRERTQTAKEPWQRRSDAFLENNFYYQRRKKAEEFCLRHLKDNISYKNYVGRLENVAASQIIEEKFMQGYDMFKLLTEFIDRIDDIASNDVKINKAQCQLLSELCTDELCNRSNANAFAPNYASSRVNMPLWEVANIFHQAIFLVSECQYVETAFLNRTAEFIHLIFEQPRSYPLVGKFFIAAEADMKMCLLIETKKPTWGFSRRNNKLMQALKTTIEGEEILDPEYININYANGMLGSGSYGEVYRGKLFGMKVAVKRLWPPGNEMQCKLMAIFSKRHPNLLQTIGYYSIGNVLYYVTELMDTDLGKLIYKETFLLITAIDVLCQIARAMLFLHDCNIVHRGLKLSNVLVKKKGDYLAVKVSDFGLTHMGCNTLKRVEENIHYIDPKVLQEEVSYTKKTDIYSFGTVCAEILTQGRFGMSSSSKSKLERLRESSESPAMILYTLIEDCWRAEPEERPDFFFICHALQKMKEEVEAAWNGRFKSWFSYPIR